jgi:IclR family transcriptional regulator, acetate operon repressor
VFHNTESFYIMESNRFLELDPLVQSVERAFLILRALAAAPAGVTEVASTVGLPKSTVARMLATLQAAGVVEQPMAGGQYRIGTAITELGGFSSATAQLMEGARPHLTELMREIGEATGLSVADGYHVHYLDQVESPNPVQVRDWTGSRVPMHAVSSGLVFLAHWPEPAVDAFLAKPLERFTSRTVVDPSEIRRRLVGVRDKGWVWVREEFAEGINSVAAPIREASGAVVAAVHSHGPAYRFPVRRVEEQALGRRVKAAGERIAWRLSHR